MSAALCMNVGNFLGKRLIIQGLDTRRQTESASSADLLIQSNKDWLTALSGQSIREGKKGRKCCGYTYSRREKKKDVVYDLLF